MPLPSTAYEVVRVAVIDHKTRQVEALYATAEVEGYITEGVSISDIDELAWISIQIASKVSANFRSGIKYVEIAPTLIDPAWVDGQKKLPVREFFATYYELEAAV